MSNVVPIWGIQRERELDEFLALEADPPALDEAMWAAIARDRRELAGDFCRGCGYCLPCPAEIPIPMAARMSFLLRRAPYQQFLTEHWQQGMHAIAELPALRPMHRALPLPVRHPAHPGENAGGL